MNSNSRNNLEEILSSDIEFIRISYKSFQAIQNCRLYRIEQIGEKRTVDQSTNWTCRCSTAWQCLIFSRRFQTDVSLVLNYQFIESVSSIVNKNFLIFFLLQICRWRLSSSARRSCMYQTTSDILWKYRNHQAKHFEM